MRDRHFIVWLVGLVVAPLLLEKFSAYASTIVYGAVILLAGLGVAGLLWIGYERLRARSMEHRWAPIDRRPKMGAMT